jgi:hypothetical protein
LGNAEQRWLKEATATWSMDYIYPEANKEHQYLPLFFKTRNVALVMRQGNKEYADYVFFLFLQENGSEKDVANVLLSAKNKSVKDVLQALTDYENKFADFSEWNWNKEPVKNYRDDPAFPDLSIQGPALKFEQLLFADEETNEVALDAGSAEYRTFDVSGSLDLKKVQFKFHDTGDSKHQRHALVKINGQWKEENWTDLEEKRFCLDKPEEKVQAIVLIYSNSDLKAPYFTEYDVDTKGECPKEITGTTTVTLDASLGDSKITGKVTSNDVLQYDETTDEYKLKSRTINCTYESTGVISAISWGQPVVISGTTTGTGSLTENYDDLATAPVKIAFDRPGKIAYLTIEPEKKNQKWVHYTMNEEMIAGQLNGKSNWTEDGDCSANMVFSDLELNTDQYLKDNVLHYERTITDTEGIVTTTLKADYSLTPK